MATKKKAKQIGRLYKVTVILSTDVDETIDESDVKYSVCSSYQTLDVQIVEKPINEF
jgi:hypothetical protein